MSKYYDYYEQLCNCSEISTSSVGVSGNMYDDISQYCNCPGGTRYLTMRDLEGEETTSWPVTVYNINEVALGTATTKAEYIALWNSDPDNQEVGTLTGGYGPFGFAIILNPGQVSPPWVIGVSQVSEDLGIYGEEYAIQYE